MLDEKSENEKNQKNEHVAMMVAFVSVSGLTELDQAADIIMCPISKQCRQSKIFEKYRK